MRFSFSWSICSTSAPSDSTSGMPAPTSTANWRVMMARSVALTRPRITRFIETSRAAWAFCSCAPSTSVRKTPSRFSTARSVLGLSASLSPWTVLPAASSALYWKTGISEVLCGHREDLGRRRDPARHLVGAVLHEGQHPVLDGRLLDGVGVDVLEDELPDVVVDEHQLVDPGAPLVAGPLAGGAADGPVEVGRVAGPLEDLRGEAGLLALLRRRDVGLLALLAEDTDEPLGEDAAEGRGDEEGLHAHLDEARDGAGGVVGVDRGEDEVAGQRGLDRDLGRLEVADLADHDDVGVLPEERPQPVREGELDLRVHLDLADALERDLDGVLDREDVQVRRVDLGEGAVEGRGLAGAGGAGDEHDPVGARHEPVHDLPLPGLEAERAEIEHDARLVQEPHHDPLAVGGGDRREP